ncbi:MAG: NYN domain-containing protein, partial [Candidatus Latescibacteria bacterium]|nr:NYN domain-containing protein [Candidatus Latescibacterota bacterium]
SQLFQAPGTSLAKARLALQHTLDAHSRRADVRITLYYDGDDLDHPTTGRHGAIAIEFSRAAEKADDLIMRAVQAQHGARWLRVVSSDREIRRFARRHKIRSIAAEDFLDELEAPIAPATAAPRDPKAAARHAGADHPDDDLDEWERAFSPPDSQPPSRPQRIIDGTASAPSVDAREVDEWERMFRRDERGDEPTP